MQLHMPFWHVPMPNFIWMKHVAMHSAWQSPSLHIGGDMHTPPLHVCPAAQSALEQHCCEQMHEFPLFW
jgi:hypothetical protein